MDLPPPHGPAPTHRTHSSRAHPRWPPTAAKHAIMSGEGFSGGSTRGGRHGFTGGGHNTGAASLALSMCIDAPSPAASTPT
eukprot:158751-Chlamydomonas_euryale.AAC.1